MEITWHGKHCFRLIERGLAALVANPPAPLSAGLKAEIAVFNQAADVPANLDGIRRIIHQPGEYEIGGVFITAVPAEAPDPSHPAGKLMYGLDFDGLSVLIPGPLERLPAQSALEKLGAAHILLLSVGNGLPPARAAELVRQLEPRLVVPAFSATEDLTRFLKEMGLEAQAPQPSLKATVSSLPEETRLVVLSTQSG